MNHEAITIMCPPYPEYETWPEDQSESELVDCPKCDGKMWLSEKKKGIIMFTACANRDIILACYNCILKMAKSTPELFINSEMFKI